MVDWDLDELFDLVKEDWKTRNEMLLKVKRVEDGAVCELDGAGTIVHAS